MIDLKSLATRRIAPCLLTIAMAVGAPGSTFAQEVDPAHEVIFRGLGLIRSGNTTEARKLFVPGAFPEDFDDLADSGRAALRIGRDIQAQLVQQTVEMDKEGQPLNTLIYHLKGKTEALLVIAQTRSTDSGPLIEGLMWEPVPLNLAERHPFILSGMSYIHWYVLCAAIAVPLFILYTLVTLIRREPWKRWFGIPLILAGFGKVSAAWLPGPALEPYFQFAPYTIHLPGVLWPIKDPIYSPWVVSFSFPLGALAYLLWRSFRDRPIRSDRAPEAEAGEPRRGLPE